MIRNKKFNLLLLFFSLALITACDEGGSTLSPDTIVDNSVIITKTNVDKDSVTLTWPAVEQNEARYHIYKADQDFTDHKGTAKSSVSIDYIKSTTATNELITRLNEGSTYYFKIFATDASIENDDDLQNLSTSSTLILKSYNSIQILTVPANVGNLSVVSEQETSVSLQWSSVKGADEYKLYRNTMSFSATSDNGVSSIIVSATTYTATGLKTLTKYYFRVVALNSSGEGELSAEVIGTPVPSPLKVKNLAITVASSSSLKLTWTKYTESGASGYKVYRNLTENITANRLIKTITASNHEEYTDVHLDSGVLYYYKVVPTTSTEDGELSIATAVSTITVAEKIPSISLVDRSTTSLKLQVPAQKGVTAYTYYYKAGDTSPTTSDTTKIEVTGGSTEVNITGLTANTKYKIKVVVSYPDANSGLSEFELSAYTSLGNVTDITATTISTTQINISWTKLDSEMNYYVYRSLDTAFEDGEKVAVSITNSGSYQHTALKAGTKYYYKVIAYNTNTISSSVNATLVDTYTKVSQVENVSVIKREVAEFNLSWESITGADSYKIYYNDSSFSATTDTVLGSVIVSTNSGSIDSLGTGTVYYYGVTAINSISGEGTLSIVGSAITTYYSAPTGVTVTAESTSSLEVSWNNAVPITDVTEYIIYYGTSSISDISSSLFVTATSTPFLIKGLNSNTQYYIQVKLSKISGGTISGSSDLSDEVSAYTFITAPTSISATTLTANSIVVSWSAVAGATDYKLCYDRGAIPTKDKCNINTNGQNAYTHTSLNDSTAYHYKVLAVGRILTGESAGTDGVLSTAEATATTFSSGATVTGFVQDISKIEAGAIHLQWTAYTNATAYNLYYEVQSITSTIVMANTLSTKATLGNVTEYKLTGLASNAMYGLKIQAVTINSTTDLNDGVIAAPLATSLTLGRNTVAGSSIVSVVYPGVDITVHRSETADCDLKDADSCLNYYAKKMTTQGTSFIDNHSTNGAFYKLETSFGTSTNVQIDTNLTINRFSGRYAHQVVVWKNQFYLSGGNILGSYQNDVWKSADGVNWTEIKTHDNATGFYGRRFHQMVVWRDQFYVIGGAVGITKNDVWKSLDGKNWTQVIEKSDFSARDSHQVVVFENELYLIGGRDFFNAKNDVWKSADGVNWTEIKTHDNATGFSPRNGHQVVVFNNELYLIGGGNKNDVWKSVDGVIWYEIKTHDNATGFSPRNGHQVMILNNELYLIGGGNKNDVWKSADGVIWYEIKVHDNATGFSPRNDHQVVVLNNELYLIGGFSANAEENDVWKSSDGGVTWFEMFSSGTITW